MGTSKTGTLSAIQTSETLQNRNVMTDLGSGGSGKFVFFAAFDGTNNDRTNLGLSGSAYQTNVANLFDQASTASKFDPNLQARYYPGVGTGGENGNALNAAISPTAAVHYAAEQALLDFSKQASEYLLANPTATLADITASAAGFSRGSATAVVFARMLHERGLVTADGTVVAPPGSIQVNGLALMDPVHSFIAGDLSIPANVMGQVLVVRAINENRIDFTAADYSNDSRVRTVDSYGNHCGIGGGYDQDGTAAAVLEGVTGYLQGSGVGLSDVPPELRFNPEKPAQLYTELYQTARNGDVVIDENGQPIKVWREAEGEGRATRLVPLSDDSHASSAASSDDAQNDQNNDEVNIPTLASQFAPGVTPNLGGAYGAGQLNGLDILPISETSHFLVNSEGDIVGELSLLSDGAIQIKNLSGSIGYVIGDQVLTQDQYDEAKAHYEQAQSAQQASQAASALGLMNSIIGLQQWDAMSDLQRVAAVTSIYNTLDRMGTGGDGLPGNLGAAASVLGLLNALDSGDAGAALYSGLYLVEALTSTAATATTAAVPGLVSDTLGGNFLPALGFVLALDSGNPVSIVSSGLSLLSSLSVIGPWGMVAGVVLALFGSLFGDDDIPMSEGAAHAQWDPAGNLQIVTDQDLHGGGPTATQWMSALANGLQGELAKHTDEHGNPLYGLVPGLLPTLGFKHDPDGFNYLGAQGHLFLSWVDENGQTQTRYYDGAGNRNNGTGETLADDFMKHAMDAIAPAWAVQTTLAHWQAGDGLHLPTDKASLPQESADGITQTLHVLTLAVPGFEGPTVSLVDVDGDGYLEATQWVQANQAMLAIDTNGDGFIGAGELLNLQDSAIFNSLHWLDANGDGRMDASDPAFAALRLWMDVNGDGISQNAGGSETQTLAQAGITAIDFATNPPHVEYANGSTQALTAQMLTADTLGVTYRMTEGGLLEVSEQADGSGVAVLAAVNTREFDGQAGHVHGETEVTTVEAHDGRLVSTGAATVENTSEQTRTNVDQGDGKLASAAEVAVSLAAMQVGVAKAADVRDIRTAFVPVASAGGTAVTDVVANMVRTAEAAGGAAAAWATVAMAVGATASAAAATVAHERGESLGTWPVWTDESAASSPQSPVQRANPDAAYTMREEETPPRAAEETNNTVQRVREVSPVIADAASVRAPEASGEALSALAVPVSTMHVEDPGRGRTVSPMAQTGEARAVVQDAAPAQPRGMAASSEILLTTPTVNGERIEGAEDMGLRISPAMLLANDAASDRSALHVLSVQGALHGEVSLEADGHVIFKPDADHHGAAGFFYTVSDAYGLQSTVWAAIELAPVNDTPVVRDETSSGHEDLVLSFTAADLLANDSDADTATDGDAIRVTRVGEAHHGTVEMEADGSVRFVPDDNYHGPASFSYWVADAAGAESRATVQLTLLPVNDAPVALGETATGNEDTGLLFLVADLLANDSDADTATDGDVLRMARVGEAQHGTVELRADGSVLFVPEANYHGSASFRYWVADAAGAESSATAVLTVLPVNDAPVARGEMATGEEDMALLFRAADLLANDTDADAATDLDTLRISRVGEAVHGVVTMDPGGAVRFVPEANYHGPASFSYWVADASGAEAWATVHLTVLAVNDLPVAQGETLDSVEDGMLHIAPTDLLANDSDVDTGTDAQVLSIVAVGNARHAAVSLGADGRIAFVPEADFHGVASFDYTVSDGAGGTATVTAVVQLAPLNDAPRPVADATQANEDQTILLSAASLLANDTDPDIATDGDMLRLVRVGDARHGSVTLLPDGDVRFVPEANYHGLAVFTYWIADAQGAETPAQVTIRLDPLNDLPVLQGELIEGREDTVLRIDAALLLANDTDADLATDGQVLSINAVGSAQHGSVKLLPDGRIEFTPEADFSGLASFSYRVSDGAGGETWAVASVEVEAINDLPVVRGETINATEDVALQIDPALLLANDADVDNPWADLRIISVGNATHGSISLDSAGALHFTPEPDYHGTVTFSYTVGDGAGGLTVGTATVEIAPVNDAPRLLGESITLDEDTQARFTAASLLANDSDVDNEHVGLAITGVSNATGGTVALVAGEIVFTPTLNRFGPASFSYTVSDGAGQFSEAMVSLDFTPVNDAPVVNGEAFGGRRNTAYTFSQAALLANDTDVEDPTGLRIVVVENAAHGTVTLLADGNVHFFPDADFTGTASFDYVVEDPDGDRVTATTTIDFSRVNTPPVATDDSFIGFEDVAFSIAATQLLVNDIDIDEDRSLLRVTAVADASHGTVSVDASGNVSFMPVANYFGAASFRYQVTDSEGASTWATAYLTVQGVNDAPVIEDIWYGRPFYGYRKEDHYDWDRGSYTNYVAVTDSATAQAVLASGQSLYLQQNNSATYAPSYYRNGMLRPVSIDPLDATHEFYQSDNGPYYTPVNDRFRQNGVVVAYDPDGNSAALTFGIGSTPQHGHAWANQYIPSNVSEYIDHTRVGPYWASERGAWQYYSARNDPYTGGDPFTISVTDSGGATTFASIGAVHAGSNISGGGGCPIVIDLSNDGIDLIHPEDSNVFMDINDDGWRDRIGWAAPSDAVLVLDANQDGRVDIDHEVSFVDHLPGARTDLEGLVAHDSDGDGMLTAADDRWKDFGLLQDRNGNGLQDEGEFISLDAAGLRSLSLVREGTPEMNQGNLVFGTSAVEWSDGRASRAGDVMFAGDGVPLPEAAQMALLFSQLAALPALAESAGTTVFQPPQADDVTDAWVAAAYAAALPTPMAVSA